MAKKKTTKRKTTKKKKPLKTTPWTKEQRLQQVIDISESNISNMGGDLDNLFNNQADRARAELEALRSAK